jgi:tetratricopeptide (TPR) repeat protein
MSFGLGDYSASRRYLENFVALAREQKNLDKPLALGLGHLGGAIFGDDPTGALALVEEGLTIARAVGDQWVIARLLMTKSDFLRGIGKYSEAMQVNEQGRAISHASGDVHEAARFSSTLQSVRIIRGDWGAARQELEPLLPIFRQSKEALRYVATLLSLGEVARLDGNYPLAKQYYSESLERARSLGLNYQIVLNANNLGFIALHDGDVPLAQTLFSECLTVSQRNNLRAQIYFALFGFAGVWAVKQSPQRAVSLLAVFKHFIESGDRRSYTPVDEQEYQHYLAMARAQLDQATFNAAWEAGRALTLEQAIALALNALE